MLIHFYNIDFVDLLDDQTNVRLFYKLIDSHPQSAHLEDYELNTLLHHAVKKFNKRAVMVLLEYDSNPWKENKMSENILRVYKDASYNSLRSFSKEKYELFDMLKIINFYDGTFINNETIIKLAFTFWEELPFATFVANQLPAVFELDKDVKLKLEMKKLIKAKK